MGAVKLKITITQDGVTQTVEAVSGPEMLKKAAVESAEASSFQPLHPEDVNRSYELIYIFELQVLDCGEALDPSYPHFKYGANIVTVSAQAIPICDPSADRFRSLKCLYLWKCSWR